MLAGAERDDRRLAGVEVGDLEVQVELLRVLRARPLRVVKQSAPCWKASGEAPPAGASCTQSSSVVSIGAPRTAE